MPTTSCQLILGSASPRRRELMRWTWLPFEVVVSGVEEKSLETNPEKYALDLAKQKGRDVYGKVKDEFSFPVVLGCDTIVVLQGRILEKPKSLNEAREILSSLSGKTHQVITAASVVSPQGERSFFDKTSVTFEQIPPDLLELYLKTEESMDKAGAYGIQGAALGFIKEITGSYSNVVGLPVNLVLKELKGLSEATAPKLENWRDFFENN